jgi:hypothetical protein
MKRSIAAMALFVMLPTLGWAQMQTSTPEEQAACRPDVRRFCHKIMGSDAIADCLKAHREKLSKPCLAVLVSHGQ